MKRIWKFSIAIIDEQRIEMPAGSKILHAGLDPQGQPCIWAEVEPNNEKVHRLISIVGTGNDVPLNSEIYLGTFIQGSFVWHVYI